MDIINVIVAAISSSGFGAILGAINGFVQRIEERKNLALRFEHEQKMAANKLERDALLHKQGMEMESLEARLLLNQTEAEAFTHSQHTSSNGETIKAFVRPLVLFYLLVLTTIVIMSLKRLVGGLEELGEQTLIDLFKACVFMVLSLTSMAVSWYFAQRSSKHFDQMLLSAFKRR